MTVVLALLVLRASTSLLMAAAPAQTVLPTLTRRKQHLALHARHVDQIRRLRRPAMLQQIAHAMQDLLVHTGQPAQLVQQARIRTQRGLVCAHHAEPIAINGLTRQSVSAILVTLVLTTASAQPALLECLNLPRGHLSVGFVHPTPMHQLQVTRLWPAHATRDSQGPLVAHAVKMCQLRRLVFHVLLDSTSVTARAHHAGWAHTNKQLVVECAQRVRLVLVLCMLVPLLMHAPAMLASAALCLSMVPAHNV